MTIFQINRYFFKQIFPTYILITCNHPLEIPSSEIALSTCTYSAVEIKMGINLAEAIRIFKLYTKEKHLHTLSFIAEKLQTRVLYQLNHSIER